MCPRIEKPLTQLPIRRLDSRLHSLPLLPARLLIDGFELPPTTTTCSGTKTSEGVKSCCFRPTIRNSDPDQEILGRLLRIFNKDVEIPILVEDTGIKSSYSKSLRFRCRLVLTNASYG